MKTKNLVQYGLKMMLTVAALSLPLTALAQDKPKIKSIDLVIPVPKPGTDLFDAREVQPTSATTEYGDLAPTGDIQLMEADYIGDFVEKDSGEMLFKSEIGVNFLAYLTNIRMEKAKKLLLSTSLSITEIAQQCGYGDYRVFTKVFKKTEGSTPSQYRRDFLEDTGAAAR